MLDMHTNPFSEMAHPGLKEQECVLWEIKRIEKELIKQTYQLKNKIKGIKKIQYIDTNGLLPVVAENRLPDGFKKRSASFSKKIPPGLGKIVGQCKPMRRVYSLIQKAADSDANVVIYGESGTGKELAAHAIHELSDRKNKEFVTVNCGAIPEALLESEFFGYTKGAFTGAYVDKHGYLDLADGGTLFLDEVAELTLNMQAKLLRSLDDGGYVPVGRRKPIKSDFRIIAATNRDLADRVKKGLMREDFFFRIHIIPITLPPLRERKEDIPLLLDHFVKRNSGNGSAVKIPEEIVQMIRDYHWPGNVRELQNVIHRYLAVESLDLLRAPENRPAPVKTGSAAQQRHVHLQQALEDFEKSLIFNILQAHQWNREKAARELGITRNTLFKKIRKFGLVKAV
ncbi:MAG: sigma-54-dependent Fis family transcriptional regulator [Desulfobacteraceae bacterium]|nr:MAG: sigma-54-dependent Fis family transcriptional regulator [Desulfobacteraceae bacterium]